MAVICSRRHSTNQFTWTSETKSFSAFLSDFKPYQEVFGRVYDDACDEGFVLVSHKTGKEMTFGVYHQEYDDGDLKFIKLIPVKRSDRELVNYVIMFND